MMKVQLRENEIDMEAETDFERDVLLRLVRARQIEARDADPWGRGWSNSAKVTLTLPDPNKW